MIRVFPRRTKWTPTDKLAFVGDPPLDMPTGQPVRVSCTFTWDKEEALRLGRSWSRFYSDVQVGGPAFDDVGAEFVPGLFIKEGVTITSRGCIRKCKFCLVPQREGKLRELPIKDGWIVQDNNLLACSKEHIKSVFEMLRRQIYPVEFLGLDARLLAKWHIPLLKNLNLGKMWFALDSDDFLPLQSIVDLLVEFPKSKKFCYVLIGFGDDTILDAEKRLTTVWDLGFYPFAMLYKGPNGEGHKSREWKQFQRTWCRPAAYKSLLKSTEAPKPTI